MILLCITNEIPGRGCTIREEHLSTCDGTNRHGSECTGCLPRPAETGLLCRSCWERFEAALGKSVDLITHLRSIEKGPASLVPTHSAPGSRVILPGSWMEGDALWALLAGVAIAHAADTRSPEPPWPSFTSQQSTDLSGFAPLDGFSPTATLDQIASATRELVVWLSADPRNIVSRTGGAEAAVDFFREVQRALAMFPLDEPSTRIRYLRCRGCGLFAVVDRPPLHYLEPRVDVCESCGVLSDPQMREFDLRLYRLEVEEMLRLAAESESAA